MFLNLPNQLKDSIQLGMKVFELLTSSKLYNVIDLFKTNFQPLPHEINEITYILNIFNILTINGASAQGYVNILDWWLKNKTDKLVRLQFKYDQDAIRCASEHGHVKVLDWWLKANRETGLELKYDKLAMDWASIKGHIHVLDWWKSSGLELKYSKLAFKMVSIKTLNWWKNSGLELKQDPWTIHNCTGEGNLKVLDWWLNVHQETGLELKYDQAAIDWASYHGMIRSLDWWLKANNETGLELKYTELAIYNASRNGQVKVLEWWLKAHKETGLDLKYDPAKLNYTSGDAKPLKWHYKDLRMEYTGHYNVETLEWWKNSGLEIPEGCQL